MVNHFLGLSAAAVLSSGAELSCPSVAEIVIVQDTSKSLSQVLDSLRTQFPGILDKWKGAFEGDVKVGLTEFTDKPTPLRGWGGRNAFGGEDLDICYKLATPLTADLNQVEAAFEQAELRLGGDLAEAQYEALLNTVRDPSVGFTPADVKYDSNGRLVTRIAVIITDDVSHYDGDAKIGIDQYNSPRTYEPGTYGGWGSPGIAALAGGIWTNGTEPYTAKTYKEFWGYNYGVDTYGVDALPPSIKERYDYLYKVFGPDRWEPVQPHDGQFSKESCRGMDYPSLAQVKKALEDANVIPIVLVTQPIATIDKTAIVKCANELGYDWDEVKQELKDPELYIPCAMHIYQSDFKRQGITSLVSGFRTADKVAEAVVDAVIRIGELSCKLNYDDQDKEASEDETPVPPAEGSKIGVIAGATGGAVAGVAAIAGLLYKQFGAAMFGHSGTPDLQGAEQVDTPDHPMEREDMEEVTMDMFQ